ncbi:MAG: endonuclease/exonuclease/phosphatase family protein [Planctomycetes bacterium]|nr:endonuclease/exonuclease/phosphatase family protein [Planctomycetota bacterium]
MNRYQLGALLCLCASAPLAWHLYHRRSGPPVVRFATFNVALHRAAGGDLRRELVGGGSVVARQLAAIVQRTAPDVLLLQEFDRDEDGAALASFRREYLAVGQSGGDPIEYPFVFTAAVNTGEPSGMDLDGDGRSDGPGDAHGYGTFPGQYGMVLLSRHPILVDEVRTFRTLPWSAMPDPQRPPNWSDELWSRLRLSSKSHWDVPIGVGSQRVHVLCSHPTPPVFDGPEDRNGCRNHDEIRFWVDYLTPGADGWIVDDAGRRGGLSAEVAFVLLGDLNCDPVDGDARRAALQALLAHPRVQDPAPRSGGGPDAALQQFGRNAQHEGDPAFDTGDFPDGPDPAQPGHGPGNLRVDYVLPARTLQVAQGGVFWPRSFEGLHAFASVSDHRLVWVDVVAR